MLVVANPSPTGTGTAWHREFNTRSSSDNHHQAKTSNSMKIVQLDAPKCEGGESPLWDPTAQTLHYIDNVGCKVHCYHGDIGTSRTYDMPAPVTAIAVRKSGGLVVNLRTGLHELDLKNGSLTCWIPSPDPPPFVFNDGKVDRQGRFFLGASTATARDPKPEGGLFSLDAERHLSRWDSGVYFSNGPCWSPDNRTFYFSDSWLNTTYAYDYDLSTGAVTNRRDFIVTEELGGRPDGATVDADGCIWIAIYGAGVIAAYRPDGRLERTVQMPVRLCSSVMFGGPTFDQLFVTTIAHGPLGEAVEAGAGYVYRIDGLGVRGIPETSYNG
jgi:L-arabinonolactonase